MAPADAHAKGVLTHNHRGTPTVRFCEHADNTWRDSGFFLNLCMGFTTVRLQESYGKMPGRQIIRLTIFSPCVGGRAKNIAQSCSCKFSKRQPASEFHFRCDAHTPAGVRSRIPDELVPRLRPATRVVLERLREPWHPGAVSTAESSGSTTARMLCMPIQDDLRVPRDRARAGTVPRNERSCWPLKRTEYAFGGLAKKTFAQCSFMRKMDCTWHPGTRAYNFPRTSAQGASWAGSGAARRSSTNGSQTWHHVIEFGWYHEGRMDSGNTTCQQSSEELHLCDGEDTCASSGGNSVAQSACSDFSWWSTTNTPLMLRSGRLGGAAAQMRVLQLQVRLMGTRSTTDISVCGTINTATSSGLRSSSGSGAMARHTVVKISPREGLSSETFLSRKRKRCLNRGACAEVRTTPTRARAGTLRSKEDTPQSKTRHEWRDQRRT